MATFVLVHGAFYGGWCWQRVAGPLREAGHTVFTPTLTGLGERAHLLSRSVQLETHIQDVVNLLSYEDLRQVILVGHSYGGIVITGVADRALERIQQIVYLDAHIGEDGKSALDVLAAGTSDTLDDMAQTQPDDQWLLPSLPPDATGISDPADLAWIEPRKGPHPLNTLAEPLSLTHGVPQCLPHTYIRCTERADLIRHFGQDPLAPFFRKIEAEQWPVLEIASGHDAMITAAEELVAALQSIAAT